jgi:hypothetical protein
VAEEPIRERILQQCETSLLAINGAGEYHLALATVTRGRPVPPEDPADLPAAFLNEGDESFSQDTNLLLTRTLPVSVDVLLRSAAADLPTLANRAAADCERALTSNPTRGGLANRTEITGITITMDEAPGVLASVRCDFVIEYRTLRGNPASKG